jgi:hypothetical protein
MTRIGKRFVPSSTIRDRMDRKDLRFQADARRRAAQLDAAIEGFRQRTGRPAKAGLVPAVVEVAIVPVSIDTPPGPVVEVELHPFGDVPPGEPANLPPIDPTASGSARAYWGLTGRRRHRGTR